MRRKTGDLMIAARVVSPGPAADADRPGARAKQLRAWLLAAGVFLVVAVVMLYPMPSQGVPSQWPHLDKIFHFGAWTALCFALWPAIRGWIDRRPWLHAGALVLLLGLWGGAIELLQGLVPTRSADAWDALADLTGALVATLVMSAYDHRVRARRGARFVSPIEVRRGIEEPVP